VRGGRAGLPAAPLVHQFYVDVEDVSDDMVRRFEFEVDTSRAVEVWEREVAANLARREGAR
jgi:3-ketosteroid 9alpha-monooxygenase subunit A